jgi:hypothetical protein
MKNFKLIILITDRSGRMVPAVALALTLYALAKYLFAVLFHRSNRYAYAAE